MTGYGFGWPPDDELYPDRMRRYLEGDKAVKQEVRAEEEARWDKAAGPSSAWDDEEFHEWFQGG